VASIAIAPNAMMAPDNLNIDFAMELSLSGDSKNEMTFGLLTKSGQETETDLDCAPNCYYPVNASRDARISATFI
jgi:hypothetical protein